MWSNDTDITIFYFCSLSACQFVLQKINHILGIISDNLSDGFLDLGMLSADVLAKVCSDLNTWVSWFCMLWGERMFSKGAACALTERLFVISDCLQVYCPRRRGVLYARWAKYIVQVCIVLLINAILISLLSDWLRDTSGTVLSSVIETLNNVFRWIVVLPTVSKQTPQHIYPRADMLSTMGWETELVSRLIPSTLIFFFFFPLRFPLS